MEIIFILIPLGTDHEPKQGVSKYIYHILTTDNWQDYSEKKNKLILE